MWDLYRDGISYSLLCKFLNCRERFYHATVRGLTTKDRRDSMEFGTIFHKLIEEHAKKPGIRNFSTFLTTWLKKKYASLNPEDFMATVELGRTALTIFDQYIKRYKDQREVYFSQEQVFKEHYTLPSGRRIIIRGRMDEIIQRPTGLLLQENKTKERINWDLIVQTLPKNMQTMFYCTAIQCKYNTSPIGVLYNVIRKPLTKQKKSESELAYQKRLQKLIIADPDHFFYRHEYTFESNDISLWQQRTLNPNLEALCDWWESIRANPTNRWAKPDGTINPLHYERPFGVYEPMSQGKGDFFDLIVNQNPRGLVTVDDLFPELEDDGDD